MCICIEGSTFESDVLVDVLFQWLVVLVNLTLDLDEVAILRVVGRVDGDDAAAVASVVDFLRRQMSTCSRAGHGTGAATDLLEQRGIVQSPFPNVSRVPVELVPAVAGNGRAIVVKVCCGGHVSEQPRVMRRMATYDCPFPAVSA
jgi:hypothetical protein